MILKFDLCDRGKFRDELNIVMDIFNDAWSENWGFVPFDDAKIEHMANEIRPIMFREGLWIGEYQGRPIAYIWMIPDVNEATRGFKWFNPTIWLG